MRRDLYFEGELLSPLVSGRLRTTVRRPLVYTRDSFACFSAPSLVFLPTKCLGNIAPWMSGAQFGDPTELRPVALGEAPFGIRLHDSRPDGRPPVSEKMLNQAPWMSGAQFGDPKELRPVALGEAPFGIRLYDSCPDGRPPVSEKMLHQCPREQMCPIGGLLRKHLLRGRLLRRRPLQGLERGPVGGRGRVTRGHHRRKPPLLFFIPKVDQERRGGRGSPW
ncbi:uncharacterized protein [Nerophis lumbriciformis]|uniref:uncharacterized protein isoform X1 n=1 Tax=Nerophis lumbriciformis TaxID=546530 RepID=UPI003BACCDA9